MTRALAVWALSAVGGSLIALFLLAYGVRALLLLVIAFVAAARVSPWRIAVSGQLIGFGGTLAVTAYPWVAACASAGEAAAMCRQTTGYEISLLAAAIFVVAGGALLYGRSRA